MGTNESYAKFGQKGSGRGHVTYFRNFGTLHISGTVRARNVKFGMQIHHQGTNERNPKLGQKGLEGAT